MRARLKTSTKRALRGLLCLAAAPMLMGSECEQPLVKDSGFDIWCGDALCDWQVEAGNVAKVPTWHERDYGVSLVSDPTAISQALPFTSDDLSCIHFDLLANVDDAATVQLDMQFDGAIVHMETIPSGAWTPLSYHQVTPSYFRSLRILIGKTGTGKAELAQIQASKASDCSGSPPLGDLARPAGATCELPIQCAGATCRPRAAVATLFDDDNGLQVCTACTTDADCGAGMVCGLGWSAEFIQPFPACAPAAAAVLGDRCLVDGECASGVCCDGVCSTCCGTGTAPACAAGTTCAARAKTADGKPARTAWQCAPGARDGAAGSACLSDDDCASGACAGGGVLSVCADGRRCTSDADCPMGLPGNPCTAIGVAGGQCQ
jgi:hypothetical protein